MTHLLAAFVMILICLGLATLTRPPNKELEQNWSRQPASIDSNTDVGASLNSGRAR